jgi:putative nucleotidyltransferase with HDIG domain
MQNLIQNTINIFDSYTNSFTSLNEEQRKNVIIKKEHSSRVAENCKYLVAKIKMYCFDPELTYIIGLLHDIGRFQQLADYNTFDDSKSIDHAELGIEIIKEKELLNEIEIEHKELVFEAIRFHNKFEIPKNLTEKEIMYSRLLRDADKLDILHVITDYYSNQNKQPNHTLTWELPKGKVVSKKVVKQVLAGKMVPKSDIESEIDVKIMQLSWIYDLNFRPSIEFVLKNRFLEKIYNTLSKTDIIIEIYRKVKVYAENKMME